MLHIIIWQGHIGHLETIPHRNYDTQEALTTITITVMMSPNEEMLHVAKEPPLIRLLKST